MSKDDRLNKKSQSEQLLEEIREALNTKQFGSLEEAQEFIDRFTENKNRVSQLDFLGLSSEQVHRMLHHPLEDLEDIIRFNHHLEPGLFQDIPIVKNILFFLTRMRELEPLKATAKGNLPLAVAQELYNRFLDPSLRFQFKIRTEEESITVNSLKHILRMCGWLKKEKNYYSLTKKGRGIVDQGFSGGHYFTLFEVFTRRFNWAFQDNYPPVWIIQGGFVFSLYLLHRKARRFIDAERLGDFFINAFPKALSEVEEIRFLEPIDTVRKRFSIRFLEHFSEYFGLVDTRREKKKPYGSRLFVKKSKFYNRYINWANTV
jgi:hypothetical protein